MEKRKTHTSTDVKRRYNEKTYSQIVFSLPKDMAAQFKALCLSRGESQASVLKAAVKAYIEVNEKSDTQ